MQSYIYYPVKIKDSTKLIDVLDEKGNVRCRFKRTYKSFLVRLLTYWKSLIGTPKLMFILRRGNSVIIVRKTVSIWDNLHMKVSFAKRMSCIR